MTESRQTLTGSFRRAVGTIVGSVPDDEVVQATLVLRRRDGGTAPPPSFHAGVDGTPLTSDELGARYGADPADLERVVTYLESRGLHVVDAHGPSRRIRVEGPAGALSAEFGTAVSRVRREDGRRQSRMRSGTLSVSAELAEVVTAVLGVDDRPQALQRSVFAEPQASATSYTPLQLAEVYGMPDADGAGQTVAIIELGGGFARSDLVTYFGGLGLATPRVSAVGVDGAQNSPGQDPDGADGEVLLDIEVIGALAPEAEILVYFAPNTDAGFVDAISTAAHATPTPAAISISWGQSEDQWTAQSRAAMDDAIADAVSMGVTVTVAAGDNGSSDAGSGAHTDFPASSPHALGCGGTSLDTSRGAPVETVWDDGGQGGATGGGVSDVFPIPDWQTSVGVPERSGTKTTGRGVPDVAGDADPQTGYQVYVDGRAAVIGGTSAVAPLWAGLVVRLVQLRGSHLGLLQPVIYAGVTTGHAAPGLRDITTGTNGAYRAGPGWDACTGLGVPQAAVAQVLTAT
ncbi:MAG TPA: S53 family peptidase [Nocardioides sp.]|uniref:S53 family peptidase n=1 Tax=Nocardioides sp. TaxID=35761 RepID=UPI002E2ECAC0|nr:S53 family peptidase [Nocardioides sp.]HEX3929248.1 S53 family peptidase [Nocardioides sp.]